MTECDKRASLQPFSVPAQPRRPVGTLTNVTVNNLQIGMTVAVCAAPREPGLAGQQDGPGRTPGNSGAGSVGLGLCSSRAALEPWQETILLAGAGAGAGAAATSSPSQLSSPGSSQGCQGGQTAVTGGSPCYKVGKRSAKTTGKLVLHSLWTVITPQE